MITGKPYPIKGLIAYGTNLFHTLPNVPRTTLPMLFSGVIFVRSFSTVTGKDEALGANMVGSLVGALLQSITFIVGIKALLLVVALLYFLSFLALPRSPFLPKSGEKEVQI